MSKTENFVLLPERSYGRESSDVVVTGKLVHVLFDGALTFAVNEKHNC